MGHYARITLIGSVKSTSYAQKNDTDYCKIELSVKKNDQTTTFNVIVTGKQVKTCREYIKEDSFIHIEGEPVLKDGKLFVKIGFLNFLAGCKKSEKGTDSDSDDELPF